MKLIHGIALGALAWFSVLVLSRTALIELDKTFDGKWPATLTICGYLIIGIASIACNYKSVAGQTAGILILGSLLSWSLLRSFSPHPFVFYFTSF